MLRETFYSLLSIPLLKDMVMEAFYRSNIILMAREPDHPLAEKMNVIRYPPASVAPLVRHLKILEIRAGDMCMRKMTFWRKIADGTLGFKNLRILQFFIPGVTVKENKKGFEDALRDFPPMAFHTHRLKVEYWRLEYAHTLEYDLDETVTPLLEKFTLKAEKPVNERWTRFYIYSNGERSKNVQQFPAPERDSESLSTRYTVKTMSLRPKEMWYKEHTQLSPGPEVRSPWCVLMALGQWFVFGYGFH
jgi:hypothetical protein